MNTLIFWHYMVNSLACISATFPLKNTKILQYANLITRHNATNGAMLHNSDDQTIFCLIHVFFNCIQILLKEYKKKHVHVRRLVLQINHFKVLKERHETLA